MPKRKSQEPSDDSRLPLRWVVILAMSGAAAVPAHMAGGPALAIATAATVLLAMQTVIK